jgi:hypothetical protein
VKIEEVFSGRRNSKLKPLLTGGRCTEVFYGIKVTKSTTQWWPLFTGGRYLKVSLAMA